jgi:hypothetical protein
VSDAPHPAACLSFAPRCPAVSSLLVHLAGEGDVNPAPGPRNWGPDSPAGTWLPEEEMPGFEGMVRKVWPDYPEVAEAT